MLEVGELRADVAERRERVGDAEHDANPACSATPSCHSAPGHGQRTFGQPYPLQVNLRSGGIDVPEVTGGEFDGH